jgi:hypothetical protein
MPEVSNTVSSLVRESLKLSSRSATSPGLAINRALKRPASMIGRSVSTRQAC